VLLATASLAMLYSCVREYFRAPVSRRLLGRDWWPNSLPAEHKSRSHFERMRARAVASNTTIRSHCETRSGDDAPPTATVDVCGTATNAFLNLARSSDLRVRRLLLLTPDRRTKHVVAGSSDRRTVIIVDPTFRSHEDAWGRYLTRSELAESCRCFPTGRRPHPELSARVLLRQFTMCVWPPAA